MLAVSHHRTKLVVPPRVLYVRFALGQTVGPPGDLATQIRVVHQALSLLELGPNPDEGSLEEVFGEQAPP